MKKLTTEEFIEKAKKVHGDKYDYSKVEYKNNSTKVCIICKEHGEFWMTPSNHLYGQGCPKCKVDKLKKLNFKSTEYFIDSARKVHGNKYDYSKAEYHGAKEKICIICPIHGEFWQTPNDHISNGHSCPKCSHKHDRYNLEEFIEKARQTHGDKYDYSKVDYVNVKTKVCILCSKHGEFWQTPHNHLEGQGCPKCKDYYLENKVKSFLIKEDIGFEEQKTFKWLGKQSFDFFLPNYNVAIECQGIQHYKPITFFGGEDNFRQQQERDKRKEFLAKTNNIKLIKYTEVKCCEDVNTFTDLNLILNELKNHERH